MPLESILSLHGAKSETFRRRILARLELLYMLLKTTDFRVRSKLMLWARSLKSELRKGKEVKSFLHSLL